MGVRKIELSDREKAAIYMHVFGGVTDWQRLFFTAYAGTYEEAAAKNNLVVVVSRWKNLERVQNFLRQVLEEKARADVKIQDAARDEGRKEAAEQAAKEEEKKTGKPANIGRDYMDPENQKRKLNEIVNRAQTTGEALDALKIIMSTQKDDRQAARDLSQVRAFLPLRCENCPLYDAARRKIQAAEG